MSAPYSTAACSVSILLSVSPIIFSSLGKVLLDTADKWIIERLINKETVGHYSVGYQLGAVANLAVASFTLAWKPYLVRAAKEENASATFSRIMTMTVALLSLTFLAISLLADNLVAMEFFGWNLIRKDFWVGLQVIPPVMLGYVFFGIYVNLTVGCDLSGKTHYYAWSTLIAAAFNVIANFALIPVMGMMGAAWATLVSYILLAGLLYAFTRRIYPIAYRWGRMAQLLAVAILFYLGCIHLEKGDLFTVAGDCSRAGYLYRIYGNPALLRSTPLPCKVTTRQTACFLRLSGLIFNIIP